MTRPELFVFLALFVGWGVMAAWALRIARKIDRIGTSLHPPDTR